MNKLYMDDDLDKKLKINIHKELFITTRTSNCLQDQGVITIHDLIGYSEKQLLTFPKLGKTGLAEIKVILYDLNLKLQAYENNVNQQLDQKNSKDDYAFSDKPIIDVNQQSNQNSIKENYILNDNLNIDMLKDWPLSTRTQNCLRELKIRFVGDLIPYTKNELLRSNNFGKKSFEELNTFFDKYSLIFGENVDPKWDDVREKLVKEDKLFYKKENNLYTSDEVNRQFKVSLAILKDPKRVQDTISEKKIFISDKLSNLEIETIIIEDIEYIVSLLNNKHRDVFKGRYGYFEEYKTLEELGKIHLVTRERIRQLESNIKKSLYNLGRVNKKSLIEYFNKNEYISFHKVFPELNRNFSHSINNKSDIEINKDLLTEFLENYCGVQENFFKTPERELVNFDKFKLRDIFLFTPSGLSRNSFIEVIQDNYNYNKFIAISAVENMEKQKLIKIVDDKVYPLDLTKNLEVGHILLNHPEGLYWKEICKLGNSSYTDNNWDIERVTGDSSLAMDTNDLIYLSDRGCHKLIKFCKELENKEKIIAIFIKTLKVFNLKESEMEYIYQKVIKISEFENLNFYDARAIIKVFGPEGGIFHYGKSGTNTIGLKEDVEFN